jgi:NTE family protein
VKVGLVLGAGGVLGGAWLVGGLSALAQETDWDPGSADQIVGTSAGSMIGALVAGGIPPWFMVAHSRGEVFEGLAGPDGRPAADADRSAGANFRLHRGLPAIGPGSLRMAFTALSNPLRHTPLQMVAGWVPSGFVSTDSLKEVVTRAVPGDWVEHPNYWAVACDYESGRRTPFGRLGSPRAHIGDAVAASCAIPGFYRPVKIGGRRYVDGGVCSASNMDLVAGRGLDLVICLNPLTSRSEGQRSGGGRHRRGERRARLHPVAHPARLARQAGARGAQGAPLRRRGDRDRAHRRGPRRDGPQLDELGAPPAGDRHRRGDGREAAAKP